MFKPAILKPRPEGRKSERIVLSNESTVLSNGGRESVERLPSGLD